MERKGCFFYMSWLLCKEKGCLLYLLFSIALLDKLVDKQEYLRNNIHKCFDLKRFDSLILFIRHVSPLGRGNGAERR